MSSSVGDFVPTTSEEECAAKGKWGDDVQLPTTGSWNPPNSKGHGTWTSEDGKYSVQYKEGYPDFTTATGPVGSPIVKGKVEIEMDMGGNTSKDFTQADKAMREQHGSDWKRPAGYTWHHSEDGTTMVLVRRDVHDKSIARGGSGAAHSGGASIAKSPEF
ncbi:HNH endonuclease [Archangium violaceum]|uniref:HNH endonuclease n=1 Tax=Archangium violaceum TaxID=83451 RepID=UPI00193C5D20|nr:HNH endonuclease [Archangium violaceum]QRK10725.1 HNH endonuclease [Archangium violaceum]